MQARTLIGVALGAALLGGVAGALVTRAVGSGGGGETVIVREVAPTSPRTRLASAPIGRTRFDPARIYASRVDGVVTIYSYFGDPRTADPHAAQGSGFVVTRGGLVLTDAHVVTTAPSTAVRVAKQVFV